MCANGCSYASYEDEFEGGEPATIPGTDIKVNSRLQLYIALASLVVAVFAYLRK